MGSRRYVVIGVIIAAAVALSVLLYLRLGNHPPVIASLEANMETVLSSGSTQVMCNASDPDGDELSYSWTTIAGQVQGEGATITWIAPEYEGHFSVSVTVTDGRGGQAAEHLTIAVVVNSPPEITGVTADASWVSPSGSLQLVCDASDPDGHELSYAWSATGGHIIAADATATWTAPLELGMYEIAVVASDGHGGTAIETLHVSVTTGQPPVVEYLLVTATHKYIRETTSGYMVGEGKDFSVQCMASQPDGLGLAYEWEWDDGEVSETSEDGSMIVWTAPFTRGDLIITVVVSDSAGNMVSQSVALEVVSCSQFG
jgi:hypothetical protein